MSTICDACNGAGGDNQHTICGKCDGAGGFSSGCDNCGDTISELDETTELCETCFDWVFGTVDGFRE